MKFRALIVMLVVCLTGCVSQARMDAALADPHSRMTANPDKFTGLTFYQMRGADWLLFDTAKIYYSVDQHGVVSDLRMKFTYAGKGWIFAKQVFALIDGERFVFTPPEWDRRVQSGADVLEQADFSLNAAALDAVRKMAKAEKVELQFRGDKGNWEHKLLKVDSQTMQIVLASWEKRKVEAMRSLSYPASQATRAIR